MKKKKGYSKKNNYPKSIIKKFKHKPKILNLKDLYLSVNKNNIFKILKNIIEEININNI